MIVNFYKFNKPLKPYMSLNEVTLIRTFRSVTIYESPDYIHTYTPSTMELQYSPRAGNRLGAIIPAIESVEVTL